MASLERMVQSATAVLLVLAGVLVSASPAAAAVAEGGVLRMRSSDGGYSYNHTLAHILVEYASAVYTSDLTSLFTWTCPRCNDHTKGFEMIEIIVDVENCLQAFVGVAPDPQSIIIAFRGTQQHSVSNWIEDLFWKQLDVTYPGMPDAMSILYMSPLAYIRSQELIELREESQDAKFYKWSALPGKIFRIRIHVYPDIRHCHLLVLKVCIMQEKVHCGISTVTVPEHPLHSMNCRYAMQDCAGLCHGKCLHI